MFRRLRINESGKDKFTGKRVDTLETGAAFGQGGRTQVIPVCMYVSTPGENAPLHPTQSSNRHHHTPFHPPRPCRRDALEAHRVVGVVPPFQLELLAGLQLVVLFQQRPDKVEGGTIGVHFL